MAKLRLIPPALRQAQRAEALRQQAERLAATARQKLDRADELRREASRIDARIGPAARARADAQRHIAGEVSP